MATCAISQCTIADGAALSRNNISAFWKDPTWILAWRHTTLEQHIAQVAKRIPQSGRLLGYARWILPISHATNADGTPAWPESIVPAVGHEEEAEIRRVAANVIWNPSRDADELDVPVGKIKNEILERKSYLRLDYLAVNPEKQGRGVATALVQSGMRQAENMGLDIFVLAFKAGVGLYKRLGFHVEKELVQDDSMYGGKGKYGVYFMIYEQNIRSDV